MEQDRPIVVAGAGSIGCFVGGLLASGGRPVSLLARPRLIAEVLSPTTRDFDTIGKLEEYKTIATLDRILIVEPNAPEVVVWNREADRTWRKNIGSGLDARIDMPEIGVTLALADIYDGVEFPPRPRLVLDTAEVPPSEPNGG